MGNQIVKTVQYHAYEILPTFDTCSTDDKLNTSQSNDVGEEEEEEEEDESEVEESFYLHINSAAFYKDRCIYEKPFGKQKLRPMSGEFLLDICRPGDLLEFILRDGNSHWAVYVGDLQVVHLCNGIIKKSFLLDTSGSYKGRIVNSLYKFPESSAEVVVRRALEEARSENSTKPWPNSECFAAWCKYGKREFKKGGELRIGKQPYFLHLHQGDGSVETVDCQTLLDLIEQKRKKEQIEEQRSNMILSATLNK